MSDVCFIVFIRNFFLVYISLLLFIFSSRFYYFCSIFVNENNNDGTFAAKGVLCAEREDEVKDLAAKLQQERVNHTWKGDMLQHLIHQPESDIRPDDVIINNNISGTAASTSFSWLVTALFTGFKCHKLP